MYESKKSIDYVRQTRAMSEKNTEDLAELKLVVQTLIKRVKHLEKQTGGGGENDRI